MPFTLFMPKLSPTMTEGTVVKWSKKVGDFADTGDVILEIATDKATIEHSALDAGFLRKILVSENTVTPVNTPLAIFSEKADESIEGYAPKGMEQPAKTAQAAPQKVKEAAPTRSKERIPVSPLARNLAKERNLSLETIKGSGPHGRILSRDLPPEAPKLPKKEYVLAQPARIDTAYEEVCFTHMRKAIADKLSYSKEHIPHFYLEITVIADKLVQMKEEAKKLNLRLTINDCIIKATAHALQAHRMVNSSFDEDKQALRIHSNVDIAVAVTIPDGLITPIITNANQKTLQMISSEMKDMAERARAGKLKPHEYQGGSFTISNLGMFGITKFQAIINPPQTAILAVGVIEEKPIVRESTIVPAHCLQLTLSCDHRVIDGVMAAEFLQTMKKLLESPLLFLT